MMKKYYILLTFAMTLAGCNDDIATYGEYSEAVELKDVKTTIEAGSNTRSASDVVYLEDHISRYQFVSGDRMTFTRIERSNNQIARFRYKDVEFNSNSSGAWERNKQTGSTVESPDVHPERIYWSDATSPHTFVGFSIPKDNTSFDWKKNSDSYYYGAIGDPLATDEVIDYNPDSPTTETITVTNGREEKEITFGYSQKLRDEDLLLTYDNQLTADNSVANIKFRHALSSVRIIVNISGFYGTDIDAYSKVSEMILKNQPTLYRWIQQSDAVEPLYYETENSTLATLWGASAPAYNQRKDLKLWNTKPDGEGQGAGKLFTFYGITVPQWGEFFTAAFPDYTNLEMSFTVTYPDPMKSDPINNTINKTYNAKIANPVNFYPGKCTTIHINLNHKDETMTIGASYQDWEYEGTPDEGALKKKETFLSKAPALAQRAQVGVTILADNKTADDATWLYDKKDIGGSSLGIYDIYGNDGSETNPYTISTANQLLSFAYEVHNGNDFAGKYVKLDADITMQPKDMTESNKVNWIGIGTEDGTKRFEGIFNGNGRRISGLYGHPFFGEIGNYAVVDKLNFTNVIGIVNGGGVVAHKNNGLLCGTNIESNITIKASDTNRYVGSLVGDNESFIVACTHIGTVEATSGSATTHIGGILGRNNGTIISTYHSGTVKGTGDADVHPAIGYNCEKKNGGSENNSLAFSCYFNRNYSTASTDNLIPGMNAFPRTTGQMQSNSFVNATSEIIPIEDGVGNEGDDLSKHHYSLNQAMVLFKQWIDGIVDSKAGVEGDWNIVTNCHTFNKRQVLWLQNHYTITHRFVYTPGAYPKVQ